MDKLTFNTDDHSYFYDGERVPCISDITKPLEDYSSFNPELLRMAARRGTLVHEACELLDYGEELTDLEIEPELYPYCLAYLRFLRDYTPTWEMIETPLYHGILKYAGTIDRYGTIDGLPCIVDIKTSSSISRNTKIAWATKLYGYDLLLQYELDTIDYARHLNLVLSKTGYYRLIDAAETEEKYDFSAALMFSDCYNINKVLFNGGSK